jgi:serine/tyrosine/threonine adenylyltransferase
MSVHFPFSNTYARLPERFYSRVRPTPVTKPGLIRVNHGLAEQLGLEPAELESAEGVEVLSGNRIPRGAEPIATVYAAHQFGGFVPQLGDGRAILLGEVIANDGGRRDIQLKGPGPTPYSRRGDGRAALGPVLREYIVSEAMYALGIPTTRALAAVTTGDHVLRETALPGAILTRVASSHIRVGTFQFLASREDTEGLRILADHVNSRHYPEAGEAEQPHLALLNAVIQRQAQLIAQWLLVGFIHGVMNTDNMSVAGETIDFGPCAFLDEYNPVAVFSAIDRQGRYAYANQPAIAQWNLTRLAECLLPLLADDEEKAVAMAQGALESFPALFDEAYRAGLRRKLGLQSTRLEDAALGRDLLQLMADNHADFTLTFRLLAAAREPGGGEAAWVALFQQTTAAADWLTRWRVRVQEEASGPEEVRVAMEAANPIYIPRNHQVEAVIRAAQDRGDFGPFHQLTELLQTPFTEQPGRDIYTQPPQEHERVLQTFCGT